MSPSVGTGRGADDQTISVIQTESIVSTPFKGAVNIDIEDSKAGVFPAAGAGGRAERPVVGLDDVGVSAMEPFGG
jgi:hypothetical protein